MSNNFTHNMAVSGGAIYINENKKNKNKSLNNGTTSISMNKNLKKRDNVLIIKENYLYNNNAEDFGGAIYSQIQDLNYGKFIGNSFIFNKAGIWGGGMISPIWDDMERIEVNERIFLNNTVNSFPNDISSKPDSIKLETKFNSNVIEMMTGEHLTLEFSLNDIFDNIIVDITKYYSSLILEVALEEKNENNIYRHDDNYVYRDYDDFYTSTNPSYYLKGNVGSFIYGNYIIQFFNI